MSKNLVKLILVICGSLIATAGIAGTVSDPFSAVPGGTISSTELNGRFTTLFTLVNGNIDNDNIKASANIAGSKLASGIDPTKLSNTTAFGTWLLSAASDILGFGTTGDTNARVVVDSDGDIKIGPGNATQDVVIKRESAGVLAIRNLADSAYEDLKADGITASGAVTCSTLTPTNALLATKGGTGITSFTKGDIFVATDSTTLTKLGIGANGQVLMADSGEASGVKWGDISAGGITAVGSPLSSIAINTVYTQAHSLGSTPEDVVMVATCTTADIGYSVGEVVTLENAQCYNLAGYTYGYTLSSDGTNLYLVTGSHYLPTILNKSTKAAAQMTGGSWSWQFGVRE